MIFEPHHTGFPHSVNNAVRYVLGLPEQASDMARHIDYLHFFVISVTMAGAAAVGLTCLYYVWYYREGKGHGVDAPRDRRPGHSRGGIPIALEITIIVMLLSLFVSWWVIGFRQYVQLREPPDDAIEVYVTGKQWMWTFAYPNGVGTQSVLYVPVDQNVKLVMTSRDVIHSFYLPEFREKQDVIPGRSTTLWLRANHAGTFHLYCAEYCGVGHSTMRGKVVALPPAEYQRKMAELQSTGIAGPESQSPEVVGGSVPAQPLTLAEVGQKVATDKGCSRCHTVDGTAHIGPTWAGLYGSKVPLQGGKTVIADEQYLTESMMDPTAKVHLGFKPVMPSYQGLLTAPQVGALVEYIRSLENLSPESGDQPAPAQVEGPVPLQQQGTPPAPGTPAEHVGRTPSQGPPPNLTATPSETKEHTPTKTPNPTDLGNPTSPAPESTSRSIGPSDE